MYRLLALHRYIIFHSASTNDKICNNTNIGFLNVATMYITTALDHNVYRLNTHHPGARDRTPNGSETSMIVYCVSLCSAFII